MARRTALRFLGHSLRRTKVDAYVDLKIGPRKDDRLSVFVDSCGHWMLVGMPRVLLAWEDMQHGRTLWARLGNRKHLMSWSVCCLNASVCWQRCSTTNLRLDA